MANFADDGEIGTREYYRNRAEKMSGRISELEAINKEYKEYIKRVAELNRREDTWFPHKAKLEKRISELESALEKAQQCLRRCADEWEGLSDSTLDNLKHHRGIAKWIGETLQQLEQDLKGEEE